MCEKKNEDDNGFIWEQCKENVQPLKQGRRIGTLNEALATPIRANNTPALSTPGTAEKMLTLKQQKEEFEKHLRLDSPDPLKVWIKYIDWIDQNYPTGDNDLEKMLILAVKKFQDNEMYKNDIRFVRLCIRMARRNIDSNEIFMFLNSKGIGKSVSSFYVEWCKTVAINENYDTAINICQLGFENCSENIDDLIQAIKYLKERKEENCATKRELDNDLNDARQAFGKLGVIGHKQKPPVDRISNQSAGIYSSKKSSTSERENKSIISIKPDENNELHRLPPLPWNSMPEKTDRVENLQTLETIAGKKVKQKVCKSLNLNDDHASVKFAIYQDEDQDLIQSTNFQDKVPVLTELKKKDIIEKSNNNFNKDEERPEDAMGIIIDWNVIYGGLEEMSIEEYRFMTQPSRIKSKCKQKYQNIKINCDILRENPFTDNLMSFEEYLFYSKYQKQNKNKICKISDKSFNCEKNTKLMKNSSENSDTPSSSLTDSTTTIKLTLNDESLKTPKKTESNIESFSHVNDKKTKEYLHASTYSQQTPNTFFARNFLSSAINQSYTYNNFEETIPPNIDEKVNTTEQNLFIELNTNAGGMIDSKNELQSDNIESEKNVKSIVSNSKFLPVGDFAIFVDEGNESILKKNEIDSKTQIKMQDSPQPKLLNKHSFKNLINNIHDDDENFGETAGKKRSIIDKVCQLTPIMEVSTEAYSLGQLSHSSGSSIHSIHSYALSSSSSTSSSSVSLNESSAGIPISLNEGQNQSLMNIANDTIYLKTENPFHDDFEERLLQRYRRNLNTYMNYHQMDGNLPKVRVKNIVDIGGECWNIILKLGEGAFSAVYAVEDEEGNDNFVLKVQRKQLNRWEFYIMNECQKRLESCPLFPSVKNSVIQVKDGYFYENGSIFVCNRFRYGSLLDLVNVTKNLTDNIILLLIIAIELLFIVERIHCFKMIHADLKADNVLIRDIPKLTDAYVQNPRTMFSLETNCVALIDLGRMIDLNLYKDGTTFNSKTTTEKCVEMRSDKSWTYHPDYFGLAGILYMLHFGKYMEIHKTGDFWYPNEVVKRYVIGCDIWKKLFHDLINIPDCVEMPNITMHREKLIGLLEKELPQKVDIYENNRLELLRKLNNC